MIGPFKTKLEAENVMVHAYEEMCYCLACECGKWKEGWYIGESTPTGKLISRGPEDCPCEKVKP